MKKNTNRGASVGMLYLYTFLSFIFINCFIFNIEGIAGFIIDLGVNSDVQNKIELLIFGSSQL